MKSLAKSNKAQRLVEDFRVQFEGKTFTRALNGVSVSIKGTMDVVDVQAPQALPAADFLLAYQHCLQVVKYARSIALVQIRNQLLKDSFDVTSLIPEVQEALDFLEANPRPADLSADA